MQLGSVEGLQVVVDDADVARAELSERTVRVSDGPKIPVGRFVFIKDPDRNAWALQRLPWPGRG
jgi:hypothetical protein